MVETEEKLETIEVVKRNGKKVEFDGTKEMCIRDRDRTKITKIFGSFIGTKED